MRNILLASLIAMTVVVALPARAQTYNPDYPVCMQVYSPFQYFDCRFTSIPQCKASASARGAQCVVNLYYAGDDNVPVRHRRRAY